jgi:hypothetical protein
MDAIQKAINATPRSHSRVYCLAIIASFGLLILGPTSTFAAKPPSKNISVSINPISSSLSGGTTQQFTATVSGAGNKSVSWSGTGGTITTTGLYTAPSTPGTYTLIATSLADPSQSASATVSVTPTTASSTTITISPGSTSVQAGASQQFTTTVTGTANTAVTWAGTGGTITSSGLYTAPYTPGTYSLTATSVADTTQSASATVTVIAPVSVSINPTASSVAPGNTQQFSATVSGSTNSSVTWTASGGAISSSGLYTAPSISGTYLVTATSVADSSKSASATVTVSAPVSVSVTPTATSLIAGGTQPFTATVSGTTNSSVTWTASGGTISSSGLYTAPSIVGTYSVTAKSVADSTKFATATITVSGTQLLSISPPSLSFGNVLVGNSANQSVTLSNAGTGSVTVSAANFTGGVFSASGLSLPVTIAAGGSRSVNIIFLPDISGPFSGSVSFVSDATNSPASAGLSGSGVATQQHSVDLSWVGSTSTGVVGYYVYRSTTSGSGYGKLNASGAAPTTTYTDSTAQSGVTYYYVVTAVDGSGNESTYSNQSIAAVPTP